MNIIPPWLKANDKIAITAPAGTVDRASVKLALAEAESWGLIPVVGQTIGTQYYKYAAPDTDRLAELQEFINDPDIKAIWCARGGYGVIRILQKLKWNRLKTHAKWIIGLSDITHLHAGIVNLAGVCSIHGFMPVGMGRTNAEHSLRSLKELLFGTVSAYTFPTGNGSIAGRAEGELVGGNLSILYSMIGTPYDFNPENKILFLEEVGEHHYHIDRMIQSFKLARKFNGLKGLIVGSFSDMQDDADEFGSDVKSIISELITPYKIPVWFDFPVGHDHPNIALPLGIQVIMDVNDDESTIKFDLP